MKRSQPQLLGAIIDQMLTMAERDPQSRTSYIQGLWPKVVGTHIAAYTTKVRLEGRVLHVYISSASLKEQLGYGRALITQKINELLDEPALDDVLIH